MSEYSKELIEKLKKAQNIEEVAQLLKEYFQDESEAENVWKKLEALRSREQKLSLDEFTAVTGGGDWPDEPCWDVVKRPW